MQDPSPRSRSTRCPTMLDSPRLIPGDGAFGGRNETGTERPLVAQARRCVTVPTLPRSCRWPTKRRLLIEITPWLEWIAPVETRYGARRHACGRDRSEGLPSPLASLFAGARIGGATRRRRTVRNLRGRAQRRHHHRGAQHRTPIRGRSTAAARDLISADSLLAMRCTAVRTEPYRAGRSLWYA
jgi:hypothetical protein